MVRAEGGKTLRLVESRSQKRLGVSIECRGPFASAQFGVERRDLARLQAFVATPTGEALLLDGPPDEGGRLELAWNPQRSRLRVVIEPVTPWTGDLPSIDLRRAELDAFLQGLRDLQAV